MDKNIVFFDIETKQLIPSNGDLSGLEIAIAGVKHGSNDFFFQENEVDNLLASLQKADLIVGHNILRFDYIILKKYAKPELIESLKPKTFDMHFELDRLTGRWISLDDLAKRNVGMTKTVDSKLIPQMWQMGKRDEVKEYLKNDLNMTEKVYLHAKTQGKLKYDHKEYGKSLGERVISLKW